MQGVQYAVDIVFCIDATGSMGHLIDTVKTNALRFETDLQHLMEDAGKHIDELRVRVVAFRDYYCDGEIALQASPFFHLPQQKDEFAAFVKGLRADGGGDEPETSLEALAEAIRSEWSKSGDRRRQIIAFWTDASAHPLEKQADAKPAHYPTDLPNNFDDLTDWWEGQYHMSQTAKRLILYAPDAYAWTDIATHWSNTVHYPSKAGEGLEEVDYQSILNSIVNSV